MAQAHTAIYLLWHQSLFFQNFCHLCFLGKFGSIICIFTNWLKFGTVVDCYMLISILMFIFSYFLSVIFFGQIWSQNLKFFKLSEIWYRGRLLYAYFNFDVYFSKIFVNNIFRHICSQSLKISKLNEILYIGTLLHAFNVLVFQNFVIHLTLGKFG